MSARYDSTPHAFECQTAGGGTARLLDVVLARKPLNFYVIDDDLTVHLRRGDEAGISGDRLPDDLRSAVRTLFASATGDTAVIPVRQDMALRMLRLYGGPKPRYALFLEPFRTRDFLQSAVTRFALTRREGTILDLVVRGTSTNEIAARLSITEATVHQHVKNIGSKVGVTKRNAIVATVVGLNAA
jgi:DNA-binding NarL/FixJ family response regulator